jgi:predicted  nucleic acid-binding Zn-ribbon protein
MPKTYLPKANDELASLLQRKAKLEEKIQQAQTRQKEQERLTEEKRKLVAGGIFLDFMAANPSDDLARRLSELLNQHLTRPLERDLFPALVNPKTAHNDNQPSVEKS